MRIPALDAQIEFINKLLHIGRVEQTVITFLDRASGFVHDAVISKFLDAFFAALPESNALSLRSEKKTNRSPTSQNVSTPTPHTTRTASTPRRGAVLASRL